uniref:Beta,beta-carotene 9',10'-oxygenase n=1 Tax=Lygus hesperus TaxID=30085 RepID=A0A146MFP7_LYGHE
MTKKIAPLFKSTDEQIEPLTATITGDIPKWLKGDFLSIGPGVFDIKDFTVNHWCDGFGVVCKFSILGDKAQVTFTKRHINSDAYNKAKTVGKPVYTEFGTKAYSDPSKGFFSKIMNNVLPELTDNETNCIYKLGQTIYLATESANKRTLNVKSLLSEGKVDLTDTMKINLACSHVYFDPDGTGYTLGTSLTSGVKTQIFKIEPKGCKPGEEFKNATPLCTLPSRYKTSISFSHSFGLGEKQIVYIEQPLFMNGMKLISMTMKGKCMWDTMEWKPEEKNRFTVVDKSTGQVSPVIYESDVAFFYHHLINVYESNGQVVVDVMAHDSPEVFDRLWLKELRKGVYALKDKPSARRFILPLLKTEKDLTALPENENLIDPSMNATAKRVGDKIIVSSKMLAEPTYDLPTVNPRCSGKVYSYFYATGMYADGPFSNSVVKVNVETGDIIKWTGEENQFPGEPLFIQQPGTTQEDDGVVVSIVVDTESNEAFLLILKAENMNEIARATITAHVPCLLHGLFVDNH